MKKMFRKVTAMALVVSMVSSMVAMVPAFAAATSSKDQISTVSSSSAYAYYKQDGTIYTTDQADEGVDSSYNMASGDGGSTVEVYKNISHTDAENVFEIELKVVTTDNIDELNISPDAAVVLVMDSSGSMAYNVAGEEIGQNYMIRSSYVAVGPSRLELAQDAAEDFIEGYAQDANGSQRWLSLVSFNKYATVVQDWVDVADADTAAKSLDSVYAGIEALVANEGTNIHAGLTAANTLLDSSEISEIKSVYVVLLSDGAPTYYTGDNGSIQGTGASTTTTIVDYTNAMAATVREKASVYTLAFGVGSDSCYTSGKDIVTINEWLSESVASDPSMHVDASDGETLTLGFEQIVERIAQLASAWQVTDPMGLNIILDADSIEGSNNYSVSEDGSTITWNLRNDVPTTADDSYTYTLRYTIALDTDASAFAEDTYYLTNGYTKLDYCFVSEVTDGEGNLILSNETPVQTIDFLVPAVCGDYPAYTYNVIYWLQTGVDENGVFTYEETLAYRDQAAQKYDMISANRRSYESQNYYLNEAASDLDRYELTTDGMTLNLYYDKMTTTATVIHEYYTMTTTNDGLVETLADSKTTRENLLYVGEDYTALIAEGNGYTFVSATPSDSITLDAQELDDNGDELNNIIVLRYEKSADVRTDVSVIVEHVYTSYSWQLNDSGRYELTKDENPEIVTEATVTQKYGTPFTAVEKEKDGFQFISADPSLTISALTDDVTTITLYYEKEYENTNLLTDVTVTHIYEVEKTYIDENGNETTSISEDGRNIQEYDNYYVGETFKATARDTYESNDYSQTTANSALTITLVDGDNNITIKYLRKMNLLEETTVTVNHNYTLYYEVIDEESGKVAVESTTGSYQETFEDNTYYVGQFFTAGAINKYSGKSYTMTDITATAELEGMTIELESGKNVINLFYELNEELDEAKVTVTHAYYTYVTTYVDGALVTSLGSTESGEDVDYTGAHGERYIAEEIFEHDDETYTRKDNNSLSLTLNESLHQTLDLTYERTITNFVDTGVTVNHFFTTTVRFIDGAGDMATEIIEESVLGDAYYGEAHAPLYAGMSYTALEQPDLDGREGFTAVANNQTSLILDEDEDDNVINLYYTASAENLSDANVQVIHTYTTYTTNLVDDAPVTVVTTAQESESRIYGMFAGQFFEAVENPYDFTRTTDDSDMEIQLVAGENTIYVNYEKFIDTTIPATLDVTHIYTTYYVTGGSDSITIDDEQISSWATVTHAFNVDTNSGLYELVDIDSDNDSVNEDDYTITLVEGENQIVIEYQRTVDDRTPVTVTVNHYYTTIDLYNNNETLDGFQSSTYQLYLEDEIFTAEIETIFNETEYVFQDSICTIELKADEANVIDLYYLLTVDSTPEDVKYYTVTVTYVDEDGNEIAESEKLRIRSGNYYTTEEKEIEDYTFLETAGDPPSGIIRSNRTVTYIYTKDQDDTTVEEPEDPEVPEEPEDPEVPEEPEVPETPEIPEIPEVSELSVVDIADEGVPVADIPVVDIPEQEIPLSDIPQTGDDRNLSLLAMTALFSAAGLIVLLKQELDDKKKRSCR